MDIRAIGVGIAILILVTLIRIGLGYVYDPILEVVVLLSGIVLYTGTILMLIKVTKAFKEEVA